MRVAAAALATLAATTYLACGGADELSRVDGARLALAGNRIVAAVNTEERMAASGRAAERVLRRVRKVVSSGSLEAPTLDEFGLAALGELTLVAPSLVILDAREIPRDLDREAMRTFLTEAPDDPAAALRPGAATAVEQIVALLGAADAAPDSFAPVVDRPVGEYLDQLAATLEPVWPELAARLQELEGSL